MSDAKKHVSLTRRLLWLAVTLGFWGALAGGAVFLYLLQGVPDVNISKQDANHVGMRFLDRNGKEIAYRSNNVGKGVDVQLVPGYFIDALLATEDRRFFDHVGVDIFGIARAAYRNFKAGKVVQGGSTITQQLAKLQFLTPERTLKRKVQEVYLAIKLESALSKEEILSRYLSRVYLGSGNYGLMAASKDYFGKEYYNLTLFESAMIVGLIKAPSVYNPFANAERSEERAMQVIYSMIDHGSIDASALSSPDFALFWTDKSATDATETGYFLDWVAGSAQEEIGKQVTGEFTIRTTLDMRLQQKVQNACVSHVGELNDSYKGLDLQCAIVVMRPDGAVLAMTGGRSYDENGYNRAASALRQPGSLFKVFVYTTAMEQGMSPYDIMTDKPISYGSWSPKNYNKRHIGDVSLKNAFAQSVNSVAVQLGDMVGVKNVVATAKNLGIRRNLQPHLSIALGSEEVSLLDITSSYAHFPNGGKTVWNYGFSNISISDAGTLYQRNAGTARALSEQVANRMTNMLRAVVTTGTGKNASIPGGAVAGKTGTTQDLRDAWFVGFTPDVVAGVWIGRDDNAPMPEDIGGGGRTPAKIFKDVVSGYYNVTGTRIPAASRYDGIIATPGTPRGTLAPQREQPAPSRNIPQSEDSFFGKIKDFLER